MIAAMSNTNTAVYRSTGVQSALEVKVEAAVPLYTRLKLTLYCQELLEGL